MSADSAHVAGNGGSRADARDRIGSIPQLSGGCYGVRVQKRGSPYTLLMLVLHKQRYRENESVKMGWKEQREKEREKER